MGGPKPSWPPQWLHPYLKYVYFFQMLHENKKKYKKAKNGRRSINSEETTEERKSWEYILPMRIQITRKHKHVKMICGSFHNNHNILKNRLQRSLYLKSLFKSLTLSKPVKRIYTFLWSFPVVYKYFFCLP